jgi:hypothetical protein
MKRLLIVASAVLVSASPAASQGTAAPAASTALASVPRLDSLVGRPGSELANVVSRYASDYSSITRRYDADDSPDQRKRMRDFYTAWNARLGEIDFDKLSHEGKIDYVLLRNDIKHELQLLNRRDTQRNETKSLLPFADRLLALQDTRRNLVPVDPRAASSTLAAVTRQVDSLRAAVEANAGRPDAAKKGAASASASRTIANRAARNIDEIREATTSWFRYYDGYDPTFSWWMKDPYKRLDESLTRYARTLREKLAGFKAREGQPSANDASAIQSARKASPKSSHSR